METHTIAAIATPPGDGGVAIIRLSGQEAFAIAIACSTLKTLKSHTVHYSKILTEQGESLDEVLIIPMKGPRSFTGEDVVEIHCHGGRLITQAVLARVLEAGATPAGPGEFTMRAFLNGKCDLTQAEAIQSLICAKNQKAVKAATRQLEGALTQKVTTCQKELTELTAIIEAWVDYPEEGLEFMSESDFIDNLERIHSSLIELMNTYRDGKIISEGLELCLIGAPNAGKSSLMNALLGKDRAIVTEIAGTTRDVIEDELMIDNLHFVITDTAGIRKTDEIIEREGIRRTEKKAQEADLTLLLIDASKPFTDTVILEKVHPETTLIVFNKIDLPHTLPKLPFKSVSISAKSGEGISTLKQAICGLALKSSTGSSRDIIVTEERHFVALKKADHALVAAKEGLQNGLSPELISLELKEALRALGQIIGTDVAEDILSAIFAKFCVGK